MKLISILMMAFFISACSPDYSGQYDYKFSTKKTYYKDKRTGIEMPSIDVLDQLAHPDDYMKFYEKISKDIITKVTLDITQKAKAVTGKLIISNENNVVTFDIKAGDIDNNNLMHLKLVKADDVADAGVSIGPFSLSMPVKTKLQISLDQIQPIEDGKLTFSATTSSNFPLFNTKEPSITFVKRN